MALVTNEAARSFTGIHSRALLLQNGYKLQRLFSPEHGLLATGADGAPQPDGTDALTGLPVTSLYGEKLAPPAAALQETDLVVFDVPDVGCRFYTYLWTLTHVMEACAAYQKPLLVLDRPNPTGAVLSAAEGPWLDEQHCASFLGRWRMPLRHACTLGELARWFAATRLPQLELEVVPVQGYQRHHTALHDFPFIPTSPAIPTIQTAFAYPATCLLEGLNVNEGRGTEAPFRYCGAPWIDGANWCRALQQQLPPGVQVEPIRYTAAAPPYEGETCGGLLLTVTDHRVFKPVETGLLLIRTLHQCYPQLLQERPYPTAVNPSGTGHLNRLLGQPHAFSLATAGALSTDVSGWEEAMAASLLYQ